MSVGRRYATLRQRVLRVALSLCVMFLVTRANADPVHNVGFISYDVLIPGAPGAPGINAFNISNFTGDPTLGGFALPPDFDIFSFLVFTSSSLSIDGGLPILLGDIVPGSFSSALLEFPNTDTFSSAVFSAVLSSTVLVRSDGNTFVVDSELISILLSPMSGSTLIAGTDFSLIQVIEGAPSEVPEPASAVLWVAAVGFVSLARAISNRVRPKERCHKDDSIT